MNEPSLDRERIMLERAKRGLAPGAAQRKATLARLSGALLLAPASVPSPPSSTELLPHTSVSGFTKAAATFSLRALITGVVSGAVVGFGAGHLVSRQYAEPPTAMHRNPTVNTESREPLPLPPEATATSPVPVPSGEAPWLVSRVEERGETTVVNSPSALKDRTRSAPESQASAESANYDELSYVRRAQTALRNGDPALAFGLMRSLDQVQPQGALLAERNLVRVLSLCQLDREAEARAVAAAAVESGNAPEVYRRRIESSCVGKIGGDPADTAKDTAR